MSQDSWPSRYLVDYEVEFVGKRSSNLNIIGKVSNRHTKLESRRSRVGGQPLLNNNVERAGKRKGLDSKDGCGRKRFDAAGQNFFLLGRLNVTVERLRFTFTPNGKREFVPCDQVFPLTIVVNRLLLQLKILVASRQSYT